MQLTFKIFWIAIIAATLGVALISCGDDPGGTGGGEGWPQASTLSAFGASGVTQPSGASEIYWQSLSNLGSPGEILNISFAAASGNKAAMGAAVAAQLTAAGFEGDGSTDGSGMYSGSWIKTSGNLYYTASVTLYADGSGGLISFLKADFGAYGGH